jgi:hypothetical protein
MDDKTIMCKECGQDFTWTAREQEFYTSQGFKPPIRCKACRIKKKNERSQWGNRGGASNG